jgi:hypothetical protein
MKDLRPKVKGQRPNIVGRRPKVEKGRKKEEEEEEERKIRGLPRTSCKRVEYKVRTTSYSQADDTTTKNSTTPMMPLAYLQMSGAILACSWGTAYSASTFSRSAPFIYIYR